MDPDTIAELKEECKKYKEANIRLQNRVEELEQIVNDQ